MIATFEWPNQYPAYALKGDDSNIWTIKNNILLMLLKAMIATFEQPKPVFCLCCQRQQWKQKNQNLTPVKNTNPKKAYAAYHSDDSEKPNSETGILFNWKSQYLKSSLRETKEVSLVQNIYFHNILFIQNIVEVFLFNNYC